MNQATSCKLHTYILCFYSIVMHTKIKVIKSQRHGDAKHTRLRQGGQTQDPRKLGKRSVIEMLPFIRNILILDMNFQLINDFITSPFFLNLISCLECLALSFDAKFVIISNKLAGTSRWNFDYFSSISYNSPIVDQIFTIFLT